MAMLGVDNLSHALCVLHVVADFSEELDVGVYTVADQNCFLCLSRSGGILGGVRIDDARDEPIDASERDNLGGTVNMLVPFL